MFAVLFSEVAIAYVILAIICEYLTRYGYYELDATGSNRLLTSAKLLSYAAVSLNVYYAAITAWYIFPCLMLVQVIVFMIVDKVLRFFVKSPLVLTRITTRHSYVPCVK